MKKSILLADADAQILAELRQIMGDDWDVTAVDNGTLALAEMEIRPRDIVIADLDLAEIDGTELLNRVHSRFPRSLRFILGREADRERMVKEVLGAHQFLAKPLGQNRTKSTIERIMALENWIPTNSIRDLVSRIRTLPTIPSLYLEVIAALKKPDVSTEQIGAIIAKDMAMTTKLLQVLNSASFGLSRKITNTTEAVGLLGFETVSSMVMSIKLLSEYDKVKPVYFSIDRLWRHSTDTARMAKKIAMLHSDDSTIAEAAFTGGLMHDIGKIVLASNFDEQYRGAQTLARKQQLPLWEVEKEIFGASHGEIGAYLLGLWGMPLDLLEVAAFHEHPSRNASREFTSLTAVHIANVWDHEMNPDKEGFTPPLLDAEYLGEVNVLENLEVWRQAITKREGGKTEFRARQAIAGATKNSTTTGSYTTVPVLRVTHQETLPKPQATKPAPEPVMAEIEPPQQPSRSSRLKWAYAAVAAAVLVVVWLAIQSIVVRARSSDVIDSARVRTHVHSAEGSYGGLGAESPVNLPTNTPLPVLAVASNLPPVAPSHNEADLVTQSMGTSSPMPRMLADVKLQGIIFTSDQPSAILNGRYVRANDRFGEFLVVAVDSSSVTLEYKKERTTLVLR